MRMHTFSAAVTALLFGAASAASSAALAGDLYGEPGENERPTAWEFDTSGDFVKDSSFLESGFTYSVNGDSEKSGLRLKATGGWGTYNYDVDSGHVIADVGYGGGWLGYQFITPNNSFLVYAGADYQNTSLSRSDPTNETRGPKWGFSTEAEIENIGNGPLYYDIDGFYSTGWNTYWARARVGYRFHNGNWVIGPEGTFIGDVSFDNQRLGGFVNFPLGLSQALQFNVSLGAGISFGSDDEGAGGGGGGDVGGLGIGGTSGDSAYFTFDVSANF
jgi:Cellulose biosynthesis protein BcsS